MSSLDDLIDELSLDSEREPIASELGVIQSIYGEDAVRVWLFNGDYRPNGTIRFEVTLSLTIDDEEVPCGVLVSLPPNYPATSPPQLQLLPRYIGPFGVDPILFGTVLKTYMSAEGVEWVRDMVCVFDGLEWVKERCTEWYRAKKSEKLASEMQREDEKNYSAAEGEDKRASGSNDHWQESPVPPPTTSGLEIIEAEPIVDRKSSFVGRACHITDPSQVPIVLAFLIADRRIARAAHPIIYAWRCQVGTVQHQDNDDDGETAAGGRLAHLLQILEVNNVLVVVTRYFGGIHLGPDRFKHINQAARNALDLGGWLDLPETSKKGSARTRKR